MAQAPVRLDPQQKITRVQWGVEVTGFFVVIESRHFLGNNAQIAWLKPPPIDELTEFVGNVSPATKAFPNEATPGSPNVTFPTTQLMKDFYQFWLAQHLEFNPSSPDRSATDCFLVNLDKFGTDLLVIFRLFYTSPHLINQGAAVLSRFFTHGTFKVVPNDPAGPNIRETDGKPAAVFEFDQDLNSFGSPEHPGGAKGLEITIIRATQSIVVQPLFV